MGHASRSVPVIRALIQEGHTVHLAGDGHSIEWLSAEFPDVKIHRLPETNFRYQTTRMLVNAMMQFVSFLRFLRQDKIHAENISHMIGANVIISDNRFCFYNHKIPVNIYISHQVQIFYPVKWISRLMTAAHQYFIRKYSSCWIPDDPKIKLAGMLSDSKGIDHYRYIGMLSRFSSSVEEIKSIDILVILSGPEPQRTYLEDLLFSVLNQFENTRIHFVRGTNRLVQKQTRPHIEVINMLGSVGLEKKINQSKLLICRPGYSTLMDLYSKNIPAILIPTPGQSEQEYLCVYHSVSEGKFTPLLQKNIAGQLPDMISKKLAELHSPKE